MLKKIALFMAITLASSITFATPNNTPMYKGYAGIDTQYASFKNSSKVWGGTLLGGYRWNCTGIELGLTGYANEDIAWFETRPYSNFYVDGNYYYNLSGNLELRAAVGVGYLTTKNPRHYAYYPGAQNTTNRFGGRVGAGLQYNFTNHVNSSLMYRYQFFKQGYPNVGAVALSIAYAF